MNTTFRTLIAATVIAALPLICSASLTEETSASRPSAPSRTVKYDDLNLATPAGAQALYRRIRDAAVKVCRDLSPGGNAAAGIERGKCVHVLVDVAVNEINSPLLTVLHQKQQPEVTARR